MGYDYEFPVEGWYTMVFPADIWNFNSSIHNDDTCENFLQTGGAWPNIDWIFYEDPVEGLISWYIDRPNNELTNLGPNNEYDFHALGPCTLHFDYDIPPPVCENYTNQTDCVNAGCYWYDNSCHIKAPDENDKWIAILGGLALIAIGIYIWKRRK